MLSRLSGDQVMRQHTWVCAIAVVLAATATADEQKFPDPPKGFSWKKVEEIKAAFLMPDGWHYRLDKKGKTVAVFITQEKIEKGKLYETGLSVNVIRGRKDFRAEAYAKEFVATLAKMGKVKKSWEPKQGKIKGHGCLVSVAPADGGAKVMMHVLALANTTTNTLYLIQFESTEKKWEEAWKKGQVIMKLLAIDDEI
jgi:hypothetical protein